MAVTNLKEKTARLVEEFYRGNDNAFAELYDMYVQILFNYGCKLTSNEDMLKDCIHDVFVKVYTKRDANAKIDNFASYVIISLKNRLYDEYRHFANTTRTDISDYSSRCSEDDIEDDYIALERMSGIDSKVKKYMGNLTIRQHQAITLYYLEEKKYEEICSIMNLNYHSVRNLMHRGMTKLREAAK